MGAVDRIQESVAGGTMTLESLTSVFENLQSKYREDYKLCNLSCITSAFAYRRVLSIGTISL